MPHGTTSCRVCGCERCDWLWNDASRDWCVEVDVDDVAAVGIGEPDTAADALGVSGVLIDCCKRARSWAFSSCSLRTSEASASMRANVGCGIHWNMVARKLCSEMSSVSCHCFEKQTAKVAFSSGFLQNGKTVRGHRGVDQWMVFTMYDYTDLQNHSFHSGCECNSGASLVKNSVILSFLPALNAVTRYNLRIPPSSFLMAAQIESDFHHNIH